MDEYQSEENSIKTPSELWMVLHELHDLGTASTQTSGLPSKKRMVQNSKSLFNSDPAAVNNISRCFAVGVSQGTEQHEWSMTLSSIGP